MVIYKQYRTAKYFVTLLAILYRKIFRAYRNNYCIAEYFVALNAEYFVNGVTPATLHRGIFCHIVREISHRRNNITARNISPVVSKKVEERSISSNYAL